MRDKFRELWRAGRRRCVLRWPVTDGLPLPLNLDELIARGGAAAPRLQAMQADGVRLDPAGGGERWVLLVTEDPAVAERHGLLEEAEDWGGAEA